MAVTVETLRRMSPKQRDVAEREAQRVLDQTKGISTSKAVKAARKTLKNLATAEGAEERAWPPNRQDPERRIEGIGYLKRKIKP